MTPCKILIMHQSSPHDGRAARLVAQCTTHNWHFPDYIVLTEHTCCPGGHIEQLEHRVSALEVKLVELTDFVKYPAITKS